MTIAINGIGLATAQGSVSDILKSDAPHPPAQLPWTPNRWNVSRVCFPALNTDASVSGAARWQVLAAKALADVDISGRTPLLVASCNGSAAENWEEAFDTRTLLAGTPWVDERLPVFSSSCASGIHALYAARQLLMSGAVDEVLVLAADILAQSNHENFESLRVLAEKPSAPWQSSSSGFILGEAAVVLRLVRATDEGIALSGPELGSELAGHDGLSSVLEQVSPQNVGLILGQGTGPFANDEAELAALSAFVDKSVPITTPLMHFGHTLGASGLLAIALGAFIYETDRRTNCRGGPPWPPLLGIPQRGSHGGPPLQFVLATCKALNGACGATMVGNHAHATARRRNEDWQKTMPVGPLMNQTLKQLANEAIKQRSLNPPDLLILRMDKPLSPPPSAIIGGRLLPSAVLEITPGFASQLIARCWGFTGPALCLVGDVDTDPYGLINAFRESGQKVFQVNLRGSGDQRAIEWKNV
jgi:hypothetical protein